MRLFKQLCAEISNVLIQNTCAVPYLDHSLCQPRKFSVGNRNFLRENDLGLLVAQIKYPTQPINTDAKMASAEMPAIPSSLLFLSVRKKKTKMKQLIGTNKSIKPVSGTFQQGSETLCKL